MTLTITVEDRRGQKQTTTGTSVRLDPQALTVDGEVWQKRSTQMMVLEVREMA